MLSDTAEQTRQLSTHTRQQLLASVYVVFFVSVSVLMLLHYSTTVLFLLFENAS